MDRAKQSCRQANRQADRHPGCAVLVSPETVACFKDPKPLETLLFDDMEPIALQRAFTAVHKWHVCVYAHLLSQWK